MLRRRLGELATELQRINAQHIAAEKLEAAIADVISKLGSPQPTEQQAPDHFGAAGHACRAPIL